MRGNRWGWSTGSGGLSELARGTLHPPLARAISQSRSRVRYSSERLSCNVVASMRVRSGRRGLVTELRALELQVWPQARNGQFAHLISFDEVYEAHSR